MKLSFSVLAALAVAWSGQASAQTAVDDEAKAQFDTGTELFDQGQYEQASVAFSRAYELKPTYRLLYNIGQVENELGHFAAALEAYTRYLTEGGDQIDKARHDQVFGEIARLRTRVGMIDVEGAPQGAVVLIDDRRSGTAPLPGPLFVDLGVHTVVVRQAATELFREVVKVAGSQHVVVKVETDAAAPAPASDDKGGEQTAPATTDEPKRVWTWVAFGVGGAAAITSAITGGVFVSKSKDVKAECDGNDCPTSVKDDADSTKVLGNATSALIAVAGVGIVAGVVLYFVEPRLAKGESAVEVAPVAVATPDGGDLVLVGRF